MTEAEKFARGQIPVSTMMKTLHAKKELRERIAELEHQIEVESIARHITAAQFARVQLFSDYCSNKDLEHIAELLELFIVCDDNKIAELMS